MASGDRRRTYQLDWETLFSTIRACREVENEIVGFYHSHPNGSCEPSQRDLATAWLQRSYLILGAPYHDVASAASWRVTDHRDGFVREQLSIVSEGGDAGDPVPEAGTGGGGLAHFEELEMATGHGVTKTGIGEARFP